MSPRAARSRRIAALTIAAAATIAASACAGRHPSLELPTAPPTALADADAVAATVFAPCATLSTLTAEIRLSGRAGREKLRGKLLAGFAAPSSIRVEAVAPFGQPVFILAANSSETTLLLPRDRRVLRRASPASILEALAGIALAPSELLPLLAGCPSLQPAPKMAAARGDNWATFADGDRTVYLRRDKGPWQIAAIVGPVLVAEYDGWAGRQPSVVRLRDGGVAGQPSRVDLRLALSQVDLNTTVPEEAFTVQVPDGATPITLEELRESGPMRDASPAGSDR